MLSRKQSIFYLLLCLVSLPTNNAARKSRIESQSSSIKSAGDNNVLSSKKELSISEPSLPPSPMEQISSSSSLLSSSGEITSKEDNDTPLVLNSSAQVEDECEAEKIGFEIITGYVFSAPDKLIESLPGTLMLTDCLEACQTNYSCNSINYETGLCVLFSSNADKLPGALTKSQFPVFTIYAQKSCLGVKPCARAWCIDRVQNYKLNGHVKRTENVISRRDCLELCLGETEFQCRSANYYRSNSMCELSEMDRITLAGSNSFQSYDSVDYLENNCAEEPNKLCEFKRLSGRILKTVDSVYQDVASIDECRDLCLNSPYRCHSYDFGDTGDMVCRLSHHSRATLSDIQDPYLDVPEAATYELSSCYNVSIECRGGDMVARIRTSKLFDGKVYAKGSPKSCSVDVKNALDFELRMGYQDLECNIRQTGSGRYMNDVVIQHHDMIVTSSDLGLAVTCQYDLTNKTVANDVDLGVTGDIEPALSEEVIVDSPNVVMKISSRDGSDMMRSAEVGDPLALRFEIVDLTSPYEIFVRELVAMDGADNAEITLIDATGCPTDHFIMGPIYKSATSGKILISHFDAFKFPSSEIVQFRALVTPCMPSCEPIQCNQEDGSGEFKSLISYGRRKRSINITNEIIPNRWKRDAQNSDLKKSNQDDMLLVQSIQITDKFGFDKQKKLPKNNGESSETVFITNNSNNAQGFCINAIGLIVAGTVFLLAQLAVITIWTYLYQRRQKTNNLTDGTSSFGSSALHHHHLQSVIPAPITGSAQQSSNSSSSLAGSRTDSLCKLYDNNGFTGRLGGRQY